MVNIDCINGDIKRYKSDRIIINKLNIFIKDLKNLHMMKRPTDLVPESWEDFLAITDII